MQARLASSCLQLRDDSVVVPAPVLTGEALDAVQHRGGHLQIIAAAGSGKTEVVSQRVADLLAEACQPSRSWRSRSRGALRN